MNIEKNSIFRNCIENILIYILTHSICVDKEDRETCQLSIQDLVEKYTDRFITQFNINKTNIFQSINNKDDENISKYFYDSIRIQQMNQDNKNDIDNMITSSLHKIYKLYRPNDDCNDRIDNITTKNSIYDEIGIGICCYCEHECNPLSQACGPCMRNGGISLCEF